MAKKQKKIKLTPTESGGQFYQSDRQREARRDKAKKNVTHRYIETDLEKKINEAITNRMLEGKMTPKQAGKFKAEYFIDMMDDTYSTPEKKKKVGGASGKAKGGAVRAMSSGGRAAIQGTEFKGTF